MMGDYIVGSLFNFLTPITIITALLVPSVWIAAAVGVTVAMIGVIVLTPHPDSQVVAAWLIAQVIAATAANFFRRAPR